MACSQPCAFDTHRRYVNSILWKTTFPAFNNSFDNSTSSHLKTPEQHTIPILRITAGHPLIVMLLPFPSECGLWKLNEQSLCANFEQNQWILSILVKTAWTGPNSLGHPAKTRRLTHTEMSRRFHSFNMRGHSALVSVHYVRHFSVRNAYDVFQVENVLVKSLEDSAKMRQKIFQTLGTLH